MDDSEVKIAQIGRADIIEERTVFEVVFADGARGSVSIPTDQGGVLVHQLHAAFFGAAGEIPVAEPHVTALQIGFGRDPDGILLRIATAEAHRFVCRLSPGQARALREKLEFPEDLPLVGFHDPN